jgi:NADH-quinone oxidoreductase subunit C
VTVSSPESPETSEAAPHPLQEFADHVANAVGGTAEIVFDTIKVTVDTADWVSSLQTAKDTFGLVYFSFLAGVDWDNDVAVGDPPDETVDERFEVLATVADLSEGKRVTFSTVVSKDDPALDSLTGVYAGADWHEREAAEMYGLQFRGHPSPGNLYLPDGFIGYPLRKSYRLASREVKPWPGKVDVEDMPEPDEDGDPDAPATENPEA